MRLGDRSHEIRGLITSGRYCLGSNGPCGKIDILGFAIFSKRYASEIYQVSSQTTAIKRILQYSGRKTLSLYLLSLGTQRKNLTSGLPRSKLPLPALPVEGEKALKTTASLKSGAIGNIWILEGRPTAPKAE
uniref:Uncharacterized protein n=1 Tax=Rousettus aegyptiacus TaxID=9407 RepID=A0A7J8DXR5_ROUAE|nr:hypothetical protein HJG63_008399 [Rousettus aegyptiacus]